MAPPLTLTRSQSQPSSRPTATDWAANASLASMRSMSFSSSPALARALRVAGTGPMPMMRGSTPAEAAQRIDASGATPLASAFCRDMTTTAAPPSLMPEALPAVTVPSPLNAGRSPSSFSTVVSGRGCSSLSTTTGGPLR